MQNVKLLSGFRKSIVYRVLITTLALGVMSGVTPAEATLPDPTFTVPTSPIAVNEQTPVQVFPGLTFVDSGTNYSGGWIEYAIDTPTAADSIYFETATVASTTMDSITVVGSTIFKGTGTGADAIGTIDGVKNGQNGQNLKVTFTNTFTNGSFSDNTSTTVGNVVSLSGWTAYKSRVKLGGASTVGGFATPTDNAFPATTDSSANNDSATDTNSFSVNPSYAGRTGGGYSVQLSTSGNCGTGYCIIRGPYIMSNSPVYLAVNDSVSFYWSALGASDAYDVYGYLLNTTTGATIELLNSTGANGSATQPWTQVTRTIISGEEGSYKFVFMAGTWDASGGRAEGASLLLDDVAVQSSAPASITAANLQDLSLLLRYQVTNDAPEATRTLRISTNNGAVDGVQVLNINAVNDPLALQDPGSITRLRNMSDSSTATGTLVPYDPDVVPVTAIPSVFSITGGSDDTLTATQSLIGNYGLFSVETSTGNYSYAFFADTITALTVDSFETFTVSAYNGVETATGQLVIKLLGSLPAGAGLTARTISFTSPSPLSFTKIYGESFTVSAAPSAGSGDGTITYSAGSSTACTVTGSTVQITAGAGSCSITASISAGTTYDLATTGTPVVVTVQKRQIVINGASQEMVYLTAEPNLGSYSMVGTLVGSDAFTVTGTKLTSIITGVTSVGLTVTFTSGSASNYDLTINNGALLVNPANLSPTTFGDPVRELGGFTVVLNNYNPGITNILTVSAGKVTVVGPVNGVYTAVVTGITDEVTLSLSSTHPGFLPDVRSLQSGPLYIQKISMDLSPLDQLTPGLSKVIKALTYITPEGSGVTFISLTPTICEIKLDVMVYTLLPGTCTIKAVGNPNPKILPGASATASFTVAGKKVVIEPGPGVTPTPKPTATPTPKPTPTPTKTADLAGSKLVVSFLFGDYSMRKSEETKLRILLTTVGINIKVFGYAQKSKSQPDIAISLDRALEAKKAILRLNPTAKVTVMGLGNKFQPLCTKYKNKCAILDIKG